MSDPLVPEPTPIVPQVELTVDLGAFLPETSAIGPVEEAQVDESDGPATEPQPVDHAPVAPVHVEAPPQPVDVAVLAGIEADLAAVDQALEAIDAGELGRSPLLAEFLADPPPT